MTKAAWKFRLGAIPAAGLVFILATAAPAGAQFFDIFGVPDPHYTRAEHQRIAEPHRYTHRRHHHEAKRRRHRVAHKAPPIGPFQIVVAIAPQEALLYGRDGLIATAKISTGMPAHPTPMGLFTVISKSRWHESNIYSGAPMPYMQRITWSGIALHAGPRPGYPASHGCIRLPEDFAIRLYHLTKIGARVIVTRKPVAPEPIVSSKLFVPAQPGENPDVKARIKPVAVANAGEPTAPMTFAARSSGAKASGNNKTDSDAKLAAEAASPATTGAITMPTVVPPSSEQPKPSGPVSVFVSRKQGKVFVRQGFVELFDMPVTIADPDRPIGTHVFTAMATIDDGKAMRWTVTSVPSSYRHHRRHTARRHHRHKNADAAAAKPEAPSAAEALDRITLPPEAVKRISALLIPGSSLIVSDNALSDETDDSTNFIVLTP